MAERWLKDDLAAAETTVMALLQSPGGLTQRQREAHTCFCFNVGAGAQGDSATAQGPRMCFSSTCAMAAAFLRPGCLAREGQPDDRYLVLVQRFGDSTETHAQLRLGFPVPVGWLHHGPVEAPNGEARLVGGGCVTTTLGSGKALPYSEKNWGRRWMVQGCLDRDTDVLFA